MTVPWARNDDLFLRELHEGHDWQRLPALFFALRGLHVEMPALSVRSDGIENAGPFLGSIDLLVNKHRVEIKSRRESFLSPDTFPYPTAFVDTVRKYDSRCAADRPLAYVFISRVTGAMVCAYGRATSAWTVVTARDRIRSLDEKFYACPREQLRSLDVLVSYIQGGHR